MQSVFFRVTGDGHRGIGFSGASRSAFGSRLRVPAAVMGRVEHPCSTAADQGWSALPKNILRSQVRVIRYRCGYGGKIRILNLYPNLNT